MSTHTVTLSTDDLERLVRALVGHADHARNAPYRADLAATGRDALDEEADAATVLAERLVEARDHVTAGGPDTDADGRLVVTAAHGTRFAVRVLRKGDTYGLDGCLTNDHDTPLVEFYDLDQGEKFGPAGQFVSRYYAHTLLGTGPHAGERIGTTAGLDLHAGILAWSLDRVTAAHVADWLDTAAA